LQVLLRKSEDEDLIEGFDLVPFNSRLQSIGVADAGDFVPLAQEVDARELLTSVGLYSRYVRYLHLLFLRGYVLLRVRGKNGADAVAEQPLRSETTRGPTG
jgi:hypothetical protein